MWHRGHLYEKCKYSIMQARLWSNSSLFCLFRSQVGHPVDSGGPVSCLLILEGHARRHQSTSNVRTMSPHDTKRTSMYFCSNYCVYKWHRLLAERLRVRWNDLVDWRDFCYKTHILPACLFVRYTSCLVPSVLRAFSESRSENVWWTWLTCRLGNKS